VFQCFHSPLLLCQLELKLAGAAQECGRGLTSIGSQQGIGDLIYASRGIRNLYTSDSQLAGNTVGAVPGIEKPRQIHLVCAERHQGMLYRDYATAAGDRAASSLRVTHADQAPVSVLGASILPAATGHQF
jgi:hypothetical protein